MALKFKNPDEKNLLKVMVYGRDGAGKSTFAANYCVEHGLNPVVIDVDDTNRTILFSQGRVLDIPMKTDVQTFKNVKSTIEDIKKTDFDTIIIDGVTSLLEMLTSDAKGLAQYSDRAKRFNKILQTLLDSGKNIIFIGQIDMEVIFTEDFQSPKAVIKVNSLVNEKYLCFVDDKGNYSHEVKKYRTMKPASERISQPKKEIIHEPKKEVEEKVEVPVQKATTEFVTADKVSEPDPRDNPLRSSCQQIKIMLEREGRFVNKVSMKTKVFQLIEQEVLPAENEDALVDYINKHCPEELD